MLDFIKIMQLRFICVLVLIHLLFLGFRGKLIFSMPVLLSGMGVPKFCPALKEVKLFSEMSHRIMFVREITF